LDKPVIQEVILLPKFTSKQLEGQMVVTSKPRVTVTNVLPIKVIRLVTAQFIDVSRLTVSSTMVLLTEPTHRSMAIDSVKAHTRSRFLIQGNLYGRTQFISMALAFGGAVYFCSLHAHAWINQLDTTITSQYIRINNSANRADQYGRKLGITHTGDGHGPIYDRKKFTNATSSDQDC
ncbi:MAG: hypothetical protein EZS28_052232, partial [Streblomastix strix]